MIIKRQLYNLLQQLTLWQSRQRICNQKVYLVTRFLNTTAHPSSITQGVLEVAGSKTLHTLKRTKQQRTNFDKALRNNVYVIY